MFIIPDDNKFFPHPLLVDELEVLAVGGSLNPETLLSAYTFGIFPWYNDFPIYWWNTNPRCVLFPENLKVSKSMRPYFNQNKFQTVFNGDFELIIRQCSQVKRKDQDGTWLNEDLIQVFCQLHKEGHAKCVGVYDGDQLVGGLYGLHIGKIFFGESMFSLVPNASKFGFISMVQKLKEEGIMLIDCQQETKHLVSLGATTLTKIEFWSYIRKNLFYTLLKSE